ncbi:hypothetical protein ACLB2K_021995 [Fragaria x ananassa]
MSRISPGAVSLQTHQFGPSLTNSNMTSEAIVKEAKDHILRTYADPFETYRSLRTVNPSPYLTYLQVASSQEILMSAKKII